MKIAAAEAIAAVVADTLTPDAFVPSPTGPAGRPGRRRRRGRRLVKLAPRWIKAPTPPVDQGRLRVS